MIYRGEIISCISKQEGNKCFTFYPKKKKKKKEGNKCYNDPLGYQKTTLDIFKFYLII